MNRMDDRAPVSRRQENREKSRHILVRPIFKVRADEKSQPSARHND
jgi:hypothetical protein